jgi:DNA polymerase V
MAKKVEDKKTTTTKAEIKPAKKRSGAGRPVGSGKFGVPTKVIRVPEHLVDEINTFIFKKMKAQAKTTG